LCHNLFSCHYPFANDLPRLPLGHAGKALQVAAVACFVPDCMVLSMISQLAVHLTLYEAATHE
jgi:hypothetical protein